MVDVLQNAQMFKEAYCLAKSKLDSNDTMIKTILQNYANYKFKKDHFEATLLWYTNSLIWYTNLLLYYTW